MAEEQKKEGQPALNTRLIIIMAVVLMLFSAALAFGVAYFVTSKVGNKTQEQKPPKQSTLSSELVAAVDLGEYSTNIMSADDSIHFVKVKLVLELDNEKAVEEIQQKMPRIQDQIMAILRGKMLEDLNGQKGYDLLKKETKSKLSSIITKGKIVDVYVTGLITQ